MANLALFCGVCCCYMRLPSVCPACASSCEFESTVCESTMGDVQLHDDRRGTRAFVACTVACHALDGLSHSHAAPSALWQAQGLCSQHRIQRAVSRIQLTRIQVPVL